MKKRTEQVLVTARIRRRYLTLPGTPQKNWHNADILCEIKKAGSSLAALSREAGLAPSTLANTMQRPWPKGEQIIAHFLGKRPEEIWPERYRK